MILSATLGLFLSLSIPSVSLPVPPLGSPPWTFHAKFTYLTVHGTGFCRSPLIASPDGVVVSCFRLPRAIFCHFEGFIVLEC